MHITVFGAAGKVGRLVVLQALKENHTVTAFIHRANPFEQQERLRLVSGDVTDTATVNQALAGADTVICTLSSWGTETKDILSAGMQTILPAMEAHGIKRIITVTGSGAVWSTDQLRLFDRGNHALLKLVAPKILFDGEEHIRLLQASSLEWTTIRSPVMTKHAARTYSLDSRLCWPWETVPRVAVAQAMIDQLKDTSRSRQAPVIHR